jgi:hypothetical protein
MKESFEKRLHNYGEIAKDFLKNEDMDEETEKRLGHVIEWQTKKAAELSHTGRLTQEQILEIQMDKQKIMDKLKQDIRKLDFGETLPAAPGYHGEVFLENGEMIIKETGEKITLGELMTDVEWGLDYSLDADSVPRNMRKRYLVERAKNKIQSLLDDQIALNEKDSGTVEFMTREAYRKSSESKGNEQAGFLAEKMVRGLLKKVELDLGGDFEVEKADLYQDVNQKIDFIIRRKSRQRGVRIEEKEERVGFQFTINRNETVLERKKKQVEREKKKLTIEDGVDDIVLVSVSIDDINGVYNTWKKDKKPGGPDKLWSSEDKKMVFSEVMKGFMPEEEITAYLEKIK